ncbi:MAG: hypothetical protein II277_00465 [Bacteroidales bacterium]|nr:hypothetical protein [Bacteroidales bacterium]
MKILYFHGFASSGTSGTVETLRNALPEDEIIAPDIPMSPAEALPMLRALCEQEQPDLIIGTSMGGMYAQQMFGYRRICVNPAFNMSKIGSLKTGVHKYHNRRQDNAKEFRVTKDTMHEYAQMERLQFKGITAFDKENCIGLFGINDKVVNTYDVFRKYYPNAIRFEGEHQLNDKVIRKVLLPLIKERFR